MNPRLLRASSGWWSSSFVLGHVARLGSFDLTFKCQRSTYAILECLRAALWGLPSLLDSKQLCGS